MALAGRPFILLTVRFELSLHPTAPRPAAVLTLTGVLLLLAWYGLLAFTRRIDADEGYFLFAARLVLQGQVPFVDFHYPQMPLQPYLLAGPLALWRGVTWVGGRMWAAVLATMCALVFWKLLRRAGAGPLAAGFLFCNYLLSDFGLEWAVVVKSLVPSTLFLLLGWYVVVRGDLLAPAAARRGVPWLAAGLLAGLSGLTRLTNLPGGALLLAALAWQWRRDGVPRGRPMMACLAGGVVALLPAVALASHDAPVFWLANWTYHHLAPALDFGAWARGAAKVWVQAVVINPEWAVALLLIAWGWWRLPAAHRLDISCINSHVLFGGGNFLVLIAAYAMATVPFHQYYSQATPWLLLLAAPAAQRFVEGDGVRLWRSRPRFAKLAALGLVLFLLVEPARAVANRWALGGWVAESSAGESDFEWRLSTVREVQRRIDALVPAGSRVLTWWPGYVLESHARLYPGLHDHTGVRISHYLPEAVSEQAHAMSYQQMERLIAARDPDVIVMGVWTGIESWRGRAYYEELVSRSGYRAADHVGRTVIYLRGPAPAQPPRLEFGPCAT